MKEIWKAIPGFEGIYEISTAGRLKSFKADANGYILKMTNKKGDYFSVRLEAKGKTTRNTRIHRLVAEAFIPLKAGLNYVNHINGNKQDNRVENLEWCSAQYNILDAMRRKPSMIKGMNEYNRNRRKAVVQLTKQGERIAEFACAAEASSLTGVCERNILQVCNKEPRRNSAGGFKWEYRERG